MNTHTETCIWETECRRDMFMGDGDERQAAQTRTCALGPSRDARTPALNSKHEIEIGVYFLFQHTAVRGWYVVHVVLPAADSGLERTADSTNTC